MFNFLKSKKDKSFIPKNKYTKQIPKCKGNRYVISDVHGCLTTLKALVTQIDLKVEDQLFFLGDYIDRGKHSKGVIDYIIELEQKYQVFPLKGNHEEDVELLMKFNNNRLINKHIENYDNTIFDNNLSVDKKYLDFITGLPFYFELEDYFLVHAGFNFKSFNFYDDIDDMLWIRDWEYDETKAKGKTIIHGHDIRTLYDIKESIITEEKIIPLDNGCFVADEEGEDYGRLLCLNLNTKELIVQKKYWKLKQIYYEKNIFNFMSCII